MSQVTNLAFFRARRGQSEALGAALAALMICTGPSMMPMSGLFTRPGVRLKVLTPTCFLSTCGHF
jgi:hypothetical protein